MTLWPQYLTLAWLLVAAVAGAHKGSSRYGIGVNVGGELVGACLIIFVLWSGGFFAPLGFAP